MLPFLIPVIILAGTMLWQAARYPDRREFEDVKTQMNSFRVEQAKTTEQLTRALESVARLETRQTADSTKLDQLLDRGADAKPTTRRRP
jgi:ABC-type transporter Mla subunit MlaD